MAWIFIALVATPWILLVAACIVIVLLVKEKADG